MSLRVDTSADDRLLACWAKLGTDNTPTGYHPLLFHMTDVAFVAWELWQSVLSPVQTMMLSEALGLEDDQDTAGLWCAFLAGLHDLGKASPAFQLRVEKVRADVGARLQHSGLRVPVQHVPTRALAAHGTVTAATLPDVLVSDFGLSPPVARDLGTIGGGHHGTLTQSSDIQKAKTADRDLGGPEWSFLRRDLVARLSEALGLSERRVPKGITNGAAMTIAGLVSVSDWIGSNTDFFPHDTSADIAAYLIRSRSQARKALDGLGWRLNFHPSGRRSFSDLFPAIQTPNSLQREVEELASTLRGPGIVIIEAPMGEGKTEAALYLADQWSQDGGLRGFYFALPTQATSNQMFARVRDFLESSRQDESVQLQLLHGHASLSAEFEVLRRNGDRIFSPSYQGVEADIAPPGVVAAEWFTHRRRGLLSPFGVGTIDQVLLASLQTRHVFVRLFGLSGKMVVVDEVHAYDTYMTTLLERLLEWLAALGSPVVLLSATLPRARRAALIDAYRRGLGHEPSPEHAEAEYPRVLRALGSSEIISRSVGVSRLSKKVVRLEAVGYPPASQKEDIPGLGELLSEVLAQGGCAAVICNTVRRAQEVYQHLRPRFQGLATDGYPKLELLHSQYPFHAREAREQRTLARFGRPGDSQTHRPRRAILVATQVVEQSLDLDFDLMVTEMAPADLLLQRAGRLHRHQRTSRPTGLEEPRLLLIQPGLTDGVPKFDPGTAAVYDGHVLLRTWLALSGCASIRVPEDVEAIIEAVYDNDLTPQGLNEQLMKAWDESRRELQVARDAEQREAEERWIRSPGYRGPLWRITEDPREEDSPDFHAAHQALTRLASPSAPSILLYGGPDKAWLDAARAQRVDLETTPTPDLSRLLLRHSLNISDRRVVFDLLQRETPPGWLRSPLLRHFKAVFLNDADTADVGKYHLALDDETGVTVSARAQDG